MKTAKWSNQTVNEIGVLKVAFGRASSVHKNVMKWSKVVKWL